MPGIQRKETTVFHSLPQPNFDTIFCVFCKKLNQKINKITEKRRAIAKDTTINRVRNMFDHVQIVSNEIEAHALIVRQ